ncbi:SixA phosphatase family protein [Larkinella soli]|uniref:SixA phosphatase family protein n=1 Tax=Larkinella soli TaxID=1770527 RepID=UPI000FFBBA67|nr:phosphoglycerate mutase family protein [Larkinella soli]
MRNILIGFLLAGLSACSTSTVYIVRHAEKRNDTDTSTLTPAGSERAQALAERLAGRNIDLILTTPYARTRLTAAPLAKQRNLTTGTYPAGPPTAVVKQLEEADAKNILVVGHSNTILEIAKALGTNPSRQKIESGDFDNLLIVTVRKGLFGQSVDLKEETYGTPTAP